MKIDVKILIEALKNLPDINIWYNDKWVFLHHSKDVTKCRKLTFIKNHIIHSWELIKITK